MTLGAFFGRLVKPLRLTLLAMIAIPFTVIVAIVAVVAILGLVTLVAISPTLAPVEALAS